MSYTLFISDLHLDRQRPRIIELFEDFLENRAVRADALYILGDLFEYWIGDDDPATGLEGPIAGLKTLSQRGVPVYFIHGNRDFLAGDGFAERSGCQILDESEIIDLYGVATLIMHGDTLCTDDVRYQNFRAEVRQKAWQKNFLDQSLRTREQIAMQLRDMSKKEMSDKPEEIMDVNQDTVRKTFIEHGVTRLIHGHTHHPAIHDLIINDQPAQRIVLGDWYQNGSVLHCDTQGCELLAISRT